MQTHRDEHAFYDPSHLAGAALALAIGRRVGFRRAPIRRCFVRLQDPAHTTPLAVALRGGRGGAVRIKLLLSMLWLAPAPPHDLTMPTRTWANLLGLSDPERAGTRRVSEALGWLQTHRLLRLTQNPGRPTTAYLLHECGDGEEYSSPVDRAGATGSLFPASDRYISLPSEFWTGGWIRALSGTAIASLLALLDLEPLDAKPFWVSPTQAQRLHGLSESTRQRGIAELVAHGIVHVEKKLITAPWGAGRTFHRRNILAINHGNLRSGTPKGR